jgi:hypothetical protein
VLRRRGAGTRRTAARASGEAAAGGAAAGGAQRRAASPSEPTGPLPRPDRKPPADDDFAEIEEILKRRGIS